MNIVEFIASVPSILALLPLAEVVAVGVILCALGFFSGLMRSEKL